jgi:plastocyanin
MKELLVALVLSGGAGASAPPSDDGGVPRPSGCEFSGHVTLVRTEKASAPVVVTLEPVVGSPPLRPPAAKTWPLYQRDFQFVPSALVVNVSDTVSFVNDDTDFHSVFSSTPEDPFDTPQSRRSVSGSHQFSVAGVEHIQCNIHSKMRAEVFVLKTPFHDLADANGTWRIQAPAGKWRVVALEQNGGRVEQDVSGCVTALELTLVQATRPNPRRLNHANYRQYDE